MRKISMTTRLIFLLNLCLIPLSLHASDYVHPQATDPGFQAETDHFVFFSHIWLNMHHFLYRQAEFAYDPKAEYPSDENVYASLNSQEKEALKEALAYYRDNLLKEDLRRSGYMFHFKRWVIQFGAEGDLPDLEEIREHVNLLNKIKHVYLSHFWKKHHAANQAVLNTNLDWIQKHEAQFSKALSDLCKAPWQREKIRVDISYHSKRDIPFTTTRIATHIVMDSRMNHEPPGNWFELLLHESSHHLIKSTSGFISGTIRDVVDVKGKRAPRQLYHAYLFYLSGKVAKDLLAKEGLTEYDMYVKRTKMSYQRIYPLMDAHLPAYMLKKESLASVTEKIIDGASLLQQTKIKPARNTTQPKLAPQPRDHFAMTHDQGRDKLIIFGGNTAGRQLLNDTWEFDGKAWYHYEASGPAARSSHSIVHHEGAGKTLLVAGIGKEGYLQNETWTWNGKQWQHMKDEGPSPRHSPTVGYDAARQRVIVFGGSGRGNDIMWEWDGKTWFPIETSDDGPVNRMRGQMAYDPSRQVVILFGGFAGGKSLGDMWSWDGKSWTQLEVNVPPARNNHSMATHSKSGKILLFGGKSRHEDILYGDTWEWDGKQWRKVAESGPQARDMTAMAFHAGLGGIVLFGGRDGKRQALDDMWLWDGKEWRLVKHE